MKVLTVCAVVIALFFGYIFASVVRTAEQANDAADLMMARYGR
ncbi:hypothetical protein [Paraburkholderia agricolaris]|nr:hypothetical protein [Paraburkholderia agricolaris]